jgi:proline iminopeptidase
MMSSIPAYNAYAHDVLMPQMDPAVLAEVKRSRRARKYESPRYMDLLMPHYTEHILRMPAPSGPTRCCAASRA